jgi:hypothetical protein
MPWVPLIHKSQYTIGPSMHKSQYIMGTTNPQKVSIPWVTLIHKSQYTMGIINQQKSVYHGYH